MANIWYTTKIMKNAKDRKRLINECYTINNIHNRKWRRYIDVSKVNWKKKKTKGMMDLSREQVKKAVIKLKLKTKVSDSDGITNERIK